MRLQLKHYLVIFMCTAAVMTTVLGLGWAVHSYAANAYPATSQQQVNQQATAQPQNNQVPAKQTNVEQPDKIKTAVGLNILHLFINRFSLYEILSDDKTSKQNAGGDISMLT